MVESLGASMSPAFAALPTALGAQRTGPRLGAAPSAAHDALARLPQVPRTGHAGSAYPARPLAAALAVGVCAGFGKKFRGRRSRGTATRRFSQSLGQDAANEQPIFATVSSTASTWQSAVAQIYRDLQRLDPSGGRWDFGVAFISGYDNQDDAILGVTRRLDQYLGTEGAFTGMAATASIGMASEEGSQILGQKRGESSITVTAVQLPRDEQGTLGSGVQAARPFIVGKEELMEISQLALQLQDASTDSRGAHKNSTPKAWRQWLGQASGEAPQGILLFADPTTSQYIEKNVLGGLDLAFPSACKVGGVSTHLRPTGRLAASPGPGLPIEEVEGKMAGIILPSSVAIHAIVTRSGHAVGKKLEVTKAQGHIISEINGETPQKALQGVRQKAAPLDEVLIGRTGFLLGVEAPKEQEETPASANLPPPVLSDDTHEGQWLMRSFEVMPDGELYVYNHDFKSVPRKVGKQSKTIQLHVQDDYRTRGSGRLMLERYGGARMMMDNAPTCFGALRFQCAGTSPGSDAEEREEQLRKMLGMDDLLVAGAVLRGEFGPSGMQLGGYDSQRTSRHGHSVTTCLLCYSAPRVEAVVPKTEPVAELQWR